MSSYFTSHAWPKVALEATAVKLISNDILLHGSCTLILIPHACIVILAEASQARCD